MTGTKKYNLEKLVAFFELLNDAPSRDFYLFRIDAVSRFGTSKEQRAIAKNYEKDTEGEGQIQSIDSRNNTLQNSMAWVIKSLDAMTDYSQMKAVRIVHQPTVSTEGTHLMLDIELRNSDIQIAGFQNNQSNNQNNSDYYSRVGYISKSEVELMLETERKKNEIRDLQKQIDELKNVNIAGAGGKIGQVQEFLGIIQENQEAVNITLNAATMFISSLFAKIESLIQKPSFGTTNITVQDFQNNQNFKEMDNQNERNERNEQDIQQDIQNQNRARMQKILVDVNTMFSDVNPIDLLEAMCTYLKANDMAKTMILTQLKPFLDAKESN